MKSPVCALFMIPFVGFSIYIHKKKIKTFALLGNSGELGLLYNDRPTDAVRTRTHFVDSCKLKFALYKPFNFVTTHEGGAVHLVKFVIKFDEVSVLCDNNRQIENFFNKNKFLFA